jgi:hypothetical protein
MTEPICPECRVGKHGNCDGRALDETSDEIVDCGCCGKSELAEYRVTFGQRYRHEVHPTFPAAHPDGWVTICAYDDAGARAIAFSMFDQAWSFMYGPSDRPQKYWDETFPAGELARISMDNELGDVCRVVDIGGEAIRVHGNEPPTAKDVEMLAEVVAAVRKRMEENRS